MSDDQIPSGEFAAAPLTGRIVRETRDELEDVAKHVGSLRAIMSAGAALAVVVFLFTAYMISTYAKSADVKELKSAVETKLESHGSRLDHLEALTDRLGRLEARQDRVDAQLWEIAKATGARQVVVPPPVVVTQPASETPRKERR